MNTTIAITNELKEEIKEFGMKGETYSEILQRLMNKIKERQLEEFLTDNLKAEPIEDAIAEARKRWPKSKSSQN